MSKRRIKAYFYLLGVIVFWGASSPVIKYTLGWFSPEVFLAYRFSISALVALLTIILFGKIKLPKNRRILTWLVIYAFLNSTVQLGVLFAGIERTSAVNSALIAATGPIFFSLAGVQFLKEHLTKREKVGLTIALIGTIVTIFGPIIMSHETVGIGITGNILVLVAVLIATGNAVISKKLLREEIPPATISNLMFIVGFITMAPIALTLNPLDNIISQIVTAPLGYQLGVFYMALFSGSLAYYWIHKGTKTIEVGEVGIFHYLQPIIATPIAIIWLGEKITTPFIVGAVIITVGVIIAEYKKARSD